MVKVVFVLMLQLTYINHKCLYKDNENKSLIVILNYHNMFHKYYKLIRFPEMSISIYRNFCIGIISTSYYLIVRRVKKNNKPFPNNEKGLL